MKSTIGKRFGITGQTDGSKRIGRANRPVQHDESAHGPDPLGARPLSEVLAQLEAEVARVGDQRLRAAARRYVLMLRSRPEHPDSLHGLGLIAGRLGKPSLAAPLMRAAIRSDPARLDFVGNLGNVYKNMGRFGPAIACYRKVLEAVPDSAMAYNNLGNVLQEQGDLEQAVESYRRALAARPDFPEAWTNLGNTLQKQGQSEAAVAAFHKALELKPGFPAALMNLGSTLQKLGEAEQAVACLKQVLAVQPNSTPAANKLQRIYLDQGRYREVLEVGHDVRRRSATNQMAAACDAFAHLALGDTERFRYLYGMADLPAQVMLDPPGDAPDLASFNQALAADVLSHPSLKWIDDTYETSRRGFVYGLLDQKTPAVEQFAAQLRAAIERFKAGLTGDPGHPFFGNIPDGYAINLWATVLGGGGHHPPHHHEGNWLSGVYYARVPRSVSAAGEEQAGWIVFDGFTHLPGMAGHENFVRRVEPVEGLLVLFPSYFMHATVPFTGDDTRVSLAFDLAPL